jgi:glyoxylase-like metal-dependent hydrolase (beta-lactamase superfamily II)
MSLETLAELVLLGADAYALRYQNYTTLFIVTDAGVIVTDPCGQSNPHMPNLLKEAIRSVTQQPVQYVLYSHWGADHGTGGIVFADTAQFVGHRNAVQKIAAANDPTSPLPTITFDQHMSLQLGGKTVDLYPADMSAQDDYFILHYPEGRVLMFVDLVQPRNIPFRTLLGHPDRIIARLQWIADTLDFDSLISGHGTPQMVGTRTDVLEQRQYYLDLSQAIASARTAGLEDNSPEMTNAVRAALQPTYGAWRRFNEFLPLNIEGMLRWQANGP